MPSGGVTVRARGGSDPVEAVQARRKRRHSEGSSTQSPSRQLNFQDARHDDDETVEGGGLQPKKKKKQRASEVAARKRIKDVIAEEEEEGKAVEHHDEEEEEEYRYVEEEEKQAEPEVEPRTPPRTPPHTPPRKKRASSEGDAPRNAKTRSPGTPNGLRRTVRMWTKEEENQLIAGVRKHGMGAWRKILEEGEDVFHTHRTNVDLKDKWKNLVRREANFPAREERNRVARRTAARLSLSSQGLPDDDNASVASSHNSTVNVEEMFPEIDDEDGASRDARRRSSSSQGGDETVKLRICTDDSPSHMRSLSIVLRRCPTVSALKRELTRRLLDDSPLPTNLQLVSITTRRLLADLEALDECIKRDGREFFLLYDP